MKIEQSGKDRKPVMAVAAIFLQIFFIVMTAAALAQGVKGQTTRVSLDSAGIQGNDWSHTPSISGDGRYVAFQSRASNLVAGDINGQEDIFVHDRLTGQTTRVSVDSAGTQGNGTSYSPSISADGRFVAFWSAASNLVPEDTNGTTDIFVHDRQTGRTTRVSVGSAGMQGNGNSSYPSISADGRFVAFHSAASNLVPGDTNSQYDSFVHDRQTGQTTRVSVDSAGIQGNDFSYYPSISADGRFVAFQSQASNLVVGDTNNRTDIFVHDRQTGQTTRVSVDSAGIQGNKESGYPVISANGRFVAFWSNAYNLVAEDTNIVDDAFVHDRQTGQTTRVSVDSGGLEGNSWSYATSISADGRFVAFRSYASNLVAGDTNRTGDAFVHDRQAGKTTRVSVDSAGLQENSESDYPSISADGRFVAFHSQASNLVADDNNGIFDVFVHIYLPLTQKIGIYRMGSWFFDNGNGVWDGCAIDTCLGPFGEGLALGMFFADFPLVGDWDGNGISRIGFFRYGSWYLDNGNGIWDGCGDFPAQDRCLGPFGGLRSYSFGGTTIDRPVVGDWVGNGVSRIGIYRMGSWYLDNGNGIWDGCGNFPAQDRCLGPFGGLQDGGDNPVVGDWVGDGVSRIGIYRMGSWYLDNGNGTWDGCGDFPAQDKCLGPFGGDWGWEDMPIVGDWVGDGVPRIGIYRSGSWFLDNGNGIWDGCGDFPAQDRCLGPFGGLQDGYLYGKPVFDNPVIGR